MAEPSSPVTTGEDPLAGAPGLELLHGARSIPALFLACVDRAPERVAFTVPADLPYAELPVDDPVPAPPGWRHLRLRDALRTVAGLAARLRSLGVGPGVPVAIQAETSAAWAALDLAALSLGAVVVGLYPALPPAELAFQLGKARVELLVVEEQAQAQALEPFLDELPALRHLLSLRPAEGLVQLSPALPDEPALRRDIARLGPRDVAAVVFTSGTTGRSKGVVLRHGHFLANIAATALAEPLPPGTRSIVFLPLAHSLQRFALYRGLLEESSGWFSPSIEALPEVLAACRPQVLVTVPRMLEKIQARAEARARAAGPVPHALLRWAVAVGVAAHRHERAAPGRPLPRRLRAQRLLADRLVARRVRAGLGGELRRVVSGGAALSVPVGEWFEAMGIAVCEGWGLTETCAPATMTTTEARRLGTVGPPLPGVALRLEDDGEVLVAGPGVFDGYLDEPEETAAAFVEREGRRWFRTGDLGRLDPDGFLRITGRKKAILVTSQGKNVAPEPIEKALEGGLVEQAVLLGDERPYLVALLALDPEARAALGEPAAQQAVAARVEAVNAGLPRYAQVKRWALLDEPLSVDSGELTATLKVRRAVVARRRRAQVEELYR